jgi:hypothetical protein
LKKKSAPDVRVYRVRFRYHRPSRYYSLSDSSGYPSAEFEMPYSRPGEHRMIVVRELQE